MDQEDVFFQKECDLKQYKQKILLRAIEYDLKECARNVKNTLIKISKQEFLAGTCK